MLICHFDLLSRSKWLWQTFLTKAMNQILHGSNTYESDQMLQHCCQFTAPTDSINKKKWVDNIKKSNNTSLITVTGCLWNPTYFKCVLYPLNIKNFKLFTIQDLKRTHDWNNWQAYSNQNFFLHYPADSITIGTYSRC